MAHCSGASQTMQPIAHRQRTSGLRPTRSDPSRPVGPEQQTKAVPSVGRARPVGIGTVQRIGPGATLSTYGLCGETSTTGQPGATVMAPAWSIAPATPAPGPRNRAVGCNSFFYYNNSMHGHVGQLIQEAPAAPGTGQYRQRSVVRHQLARPRSGISNVACLGRILFDRNNNVVFNVHQAPLMWC